MARIMKRMIGLPGRVLAKMARSIQGIAVALIVTTIKRLPFRSRGQIQDACQVVKSMDYTHGPVHMHIGSWIEDEVRLREDEKEPGTVEWIGTHFKRGDTFYDIGANVGSYSLIAFRFLDGEINVYGFEPGFVTFPQYVRNIELNEANNAISPFQIALYDRTKITDYHYQNLLTGGALHALGRPVDYLGRDFQPVTTLPVLAYGLDDFAEKFALAPPNHIKIDVDGTEFQILQGAVSYTHLTLPTKA